MMLDPSDEIMRDFKNRLVLIWDNKLVPVYSIAPKNAEYGYVIMNTPDITDDSVKGSYIYECTLLFDVVTYGGDRGSWKQCNSISSQIQNLLIGNKIRTQHFESTVEPYIDTINGLVTPDETGAILRKLIRIRFNIQQNGSNI